MKYIIFTLLVAVSIQQQICPILKCNEPKSLSDSERMCYSFSPENAWINSYGCQTED